MEEELDSSRTMAPSGQRNWTGQWLHLDRAGLQCLDRGTGLEPDNGSIWTEELDSSRTMAPSGQRNWTRAGQWLSLDLSRKNGKYGRGTGLEPDNGSIWTEELDSSRSMAKSGQRNWTRA
ncbi:hypothetical protein DPEC_G00068610 [Dallia pectoralis]|uniref:Uncharacterized protein n=1 Tax=Dallia pectoralis TaxID=75939 RepID=A0ACC2H1N0_DALPE|nr:hypothetical protein DPEC_G00068610 [Dallia pectoralis]